MTFIPNTIACGDVSAVLASWPANCVDCIVTSPPYWSLRDYGVDGQLGLEATPEEYLSKMLAIFEQLRRVLKPSGTLWLNMGDSYIAGVRSGDTGKSGLQGTTESQDASKKAVSRRICQAAGQRIGQGSSFRRDRAPRMDIQHKAAPALKQKDLVGMPWRLALALQAAGWYLRMDIIWHKPNPMPESIADRPTKAHEYIFLLSKSEKYFYDKHAITEPVAGTAHARGTGVNPKAKADRDAVRAFNRKRETAGEGQRLAPLPAGWARGPGSHSAKDHARQKNGLKDSTKFGRGKGWRTKQNESFSAAVADIVETRNARSVWTIPTQPFKGSHFATFPERLARRCILAGCPARRCVWCNSAARCACFEGTEPGIVLDPFMGSGTVAVVAEQLGRQWAGIELNPEYIAMAMDRIASRRGVAV